LRQTLELAHTLVGFPRHLSQHVGGFVLTRDPLDEIVPITNAAMDERTVIEWDKDDLDTLRILKVDVLALGMLTCVRKAFDLIAKHHGESYTLATVPREDPAVYDMLSKADSLGVFQVESRAQMSMLPRLRPRTFYDLVIEVAIVRPGPIQGDMVHPYLKRRDKLEPVNYQKPELEAVLSKTLGVPLFQEQAMRIAMVAGGFTAAESDRLRRAMATFRRAGIIHEFEQRLIEGMVRNGYDREFAERCYQQIEGFGSYGFPESHAASFALLVYDSAWIKCRYPAVFAAALLNSQPMGFYAPAQIVRDAAEHGVKIRPIDVNHSDWDCTLEPDPDSTGGVALRLGMRQIKGLSQAVAEALMEKRTSFYAGPLDVLRRAEIRQADLARLADADAFRSVGLDRRRAGWAVAGLEADSLPLFATDMRPEPAIALPRMALGDQVAEDYAVTSLSLKRHPLALLRPLLADARILPACRLATAPVDRRVHVAGLVLVRQQPGTAKGTIFMTIEDETGIANLIVWPGVYDLYRRIVLGGALVVASGRLQREREVIHIVVEKLVDRHDLLRRLRTLDDGDGEATGLERADPALAEGFRRLSRDFR
jgi:error-prone DNA polymerase